LNPILSFLFFLPGLGVAYCEKRNVFLFFQKFENFLIFILGHFGSMMMKIIKRIRFSPFQLF